MSVSEAQAKLREGQESFFSQPPDIARATSLFQETTRLAPNWAEGFLWLGAALREGSHFAEAETNYLRAIALDASDSRPHLHLGGAFDRQGKLEDSVRCYRDGLALKPHYGEADSRLMLADVLKRLGRTDEAVREWQTVVHLEPCYPSYEWPIEEASKELLAHGVTRK
jgi:tetratricopeptide (TPR) repeat protein